MSTAAAATADAVAASNDKEKSTFAEFEGHFIKLRQQYLAKKVDPETLRKSFRDQLHGEETGDRKTNSWLVLISSLPVLLAIMIGYLADISPSEILKSTECLVDNSLWFSEIARPLFNCEICRNLTEVPVVKDISREEFVEKYAYSMVPVLVKGGASKWKALDTFSFEYFRQVYQNNSKALQYVDENCQFFSWRSEFESLSDALQMPASRAVNKPGSTSFYFGWNNCDIEIMKELRKNYDTPYFLPADVESSSLDWIFIGVPGPGAVMHIDAVKRPSWQAQIAGTKMWTLMPVPECEHICKTKLQVVMEKGDIIVADTNQWYHATDVLPGDVSIGVGSEYH